MARWLVARFPGGEMTGYRMFYQPPATERNTSHTARTLITCYLASARTSTYYEEHASLIFRRCRLCM